MTDLTPCHTGLAAHTCAFDAALAETDVDTAELMAVTTPPGLQQAMLQALLNAITCISCGAAYGSPHAPNCAQSTFRDGATGPVDARATGGVLVLEEETS